jgi:hypothetical protein
MTAVATPVAPAAPAAPAATPAAPAPAPAAPHAAAPAAPTGDPAPSPAPAPAAPAADPVPAAPAPAAPASAPARVVPESYELVVPVGSSLDAEDVAEVMAMAKAEKLTQEEAQAALVSYAQGLTRQADTYRTQLEADAELGGPKLAETQRHVTRALEALVPASTAEGAALRTFLHKSGLGNNPHLVRVLARAGAALAEDKGPPALAGSPGGGKSIVELFYGPQPRT